MKGKVEVQTQMGDVRRLRVSSHAPQGIAKLMVGGTLVCYTKWLVISLPHRCTGKEVGISEVFSPLLGKLARAWPPWRVAKRPSYLKYRQCTPISPLINSISSRVIATLFGLPM